MLFMGNGLCEGLLGRGENGGGGRPRGRRDREELKCGWDEV